MKHLKCLLLAFVGMICTANVWAQGDKIDFGNKPVQISDSYYSGEVLPSQDQWYLLYQQREIAGNPAYKGGYMFDQGAGKNLIKPPTSSILSGDKAADKAGFLVRFLESDVPGAYYIQFGTGNYAKNKDTSNHSDVMSCDNFYDGVLRWTFNELPSYPGHYNINDYQDGQDLSQSRRLDNYGNDSGRIMYWYSGVADAFDASTCCVWNLYPVEIVEADEYETAFMKLKNLYLSLVDYYDSFEPGDRPGQYDAEAVQRFQSALNKAYDIVEEQVAEKPTLQELLDLIDELNESYEEVKNAKNGVKLANGYYRILGPENFYHESVTTEDGTEEVFRTKAMYVEESKDGTQSGKWNNIDLNDCRYLWRIDKDEQTGNYKVYNAATLGRFNAVTRSTQVTLSRDNDEVESEMIFDYIKTLGDYDYVSIRRQDADMANNYQFLHQGGHSSGAGKNGNLLGWTVTSDASQMPSWWHFESVSDEEAQILIDAYAPIRDHELLVANYKDLRDKAEKALVASMELVHTDYIQTEDQLYCPMTADYDGAGLPALIDNDYNTHWHSDWKNPGDEGMGSHYVQANLGELVTELKMSIVRRNTARDHAVEWSVYGYEVEPGAEVLKTEGAYLGTFNIPELDYAKVLKSNLLQFDGAYQYIRVYAEHTVKQDNSGSDDRTFWHAAELNFQDEDVPAENSQYYKMGEIATNLEKLLDEQASIDMANLTIDDYNKLKEAYDAFMGKYVDPSALRNAIKNVEPKTDLVVIGTDPGFWPEDSDAGLLKALVAEAKAYDEAGEYTKEQSEDYIARLNAGVNDLFAQANKVRTDKWYKIHIPSEDVYDEYGWDKSAAWEVRNSDNELTEEATFGRVIAPGISERQDNGATFARHCEEIHLGTQAFFVDINDLLDEEEAYWRFIPVEVEGVEDTYMLQNKATGLFLYSRAQGGGLATLDVQPTFFKVDPVGCGENTLTIYTIQDKRLGFVNVQRRNGNNCITWGSAPLGSNSGMMIEEVEDVTDDPETNFDYVVAPGKVYTMCFPAELTALDGSMFSVRGVMKDGDDEDHYSIVLTPVEKAEAGEPIVYVAEGEYQGEDDDMLTTSEWTHGLEITKTEITKNGLIGSFVETTIGKGNAVPEKDGFVATKKTENTLKHNTAYITFAVEATPQEGDIVIEIGGQLSSIEDVNRQISVALNGIYNLAGQRMGQLDNSNHSNQLQTTPTLSNLPKGIYIVNGIKVMVK